VVQRHTPYILTRGSRPEAVLISYDQYRRFVQTDEAGTLARFQEAQARMAQANARYSDDEVEADLAAATHDLRSQKRRECARARYQHSDVFERQDINAEPVGADLYDRPFPRQGRTRRRVAAPTLIKR